MSENKRESSSSSSDSDSDSDDSSSSSSSSSSSNSSSSSSASSKKSKSSVPKETGALSNGAKDKSDALNEKTAERSRSPEPQQEQHHHPKTPEPSSPPQPIQITAVDPIEKNVADSNKSPNQTKSTEKNDLSPKSTERHDSKSKRSRSRSQSPTTKKRSASPETVQEKEEGEITNEIAANIKETDTKKCEKRDHGKTDRRVEDKRSASRRSRERRRRASRSRSLEKRRTYNRDRSRNRSKDRRSRDRSRDRRSRSRRRNRSRSRNRSRDRRNRDDKYRQKQRSKTKSPEKNDPETIPKKQQKVVDVLTSKMGGAYLPPAKLRALQAQITDKSSAAYQRIAWEALKKSIHGFINKINVDNIGIITRQLLKENIVRGRGLLCRSIIQAQAASPTFTHVYGALVAVINSKFPNIGELLLHRLVIQFKRGFRRNDKPICISATRFIAHLINQRVAHEILALEILTLLVEMPTDDSVEVAIAFLKECGMKLQEVSAKGVNAIFEMLKNILHEGKLEKRVQYMIEVIFQVRKDGFKDHVAVAETLELVEEDDQFTHLIMLDEATDTQEILSEYTYINRTK